MYTVWVTSYYTDIFPYHTLLLHSVFSMSKGTVTMDTTDATHAHMINPLFHVYKKISLVVKGIIALVPAALVQFVP